MKRRATSLEEQSIGRAFCPKDRFLLAGLYHMESIMCGSFEVSGKHKVERHVEEAGNVVAVELIDSCVHAGVRNILYKNVP